jgi:ribosomal protein S18 acetylase RimI-like enzyme
LKGLTVRRFAIEDTDAVLAVWEATGLLRANPNPRTDIQKKLRHSPDSFFVGLYGGVIAATVMAGYDGHRGWVYRLAVLPDCQRRGIGTAMVEHAESWLRDQGCPRMKLQVDPDRAGVVEFYRKLGFERQELVSMAKWFRPAEESVEPGRREPERA